MQELVLEVEKLVWRGRGLARLDSGQVVLIDPGVFPGELVRGVISKQRRDYLQMRWTGIERPGISRRPHPCKLAGHCGGCRFGFVPRREQVRLKRELLVNELARALGRDADLSGDIGLSAHLAGKAWRYRCRGQVLVKDKVPHFKALQSNEPVRLEDCLLLARPLADRLHSLCSELPDGRYTVAADPAGDAALTEADPGLLALPLRDYPFDILVEPGVFFQANWELNQDLIAFAISRLELFEHVADLFAGAGNFALPLASAGCSVLALEAGARAVRCVRQSLAASGLSGVDVRRGYLGQGGLEKLLRHKGVQAAVLDPPRSGAGRRLSGLLDDAGLQRLVWVSCDVVNTARDVKPLLETGSWAVRELAFFDMFPQTWHMEVVLVLDRR